MSLPFWIALAIFIVLFAALSVWLRPWERTGHDSQLASYGACMCHVCQTFLGNEVESDARPGSKEWPR